MNKGALQVLRMWLERVNAGDLDGTLALYHKSAVLLPTFSRETRVDPDGIRQYFSKLSGYDSVVVNLNEDSLVIQPLSDSVISLAGLYSWSLKEKNEINRFKARFTYVIDLKSSAPIMHHHSSVVP